MPPVLHGVANAIARMRRLLGQSALLGARAGHAASGGVPKRSLLLAEVEQLAEHVLALVAWTSASVAVVVIVIIVIVATTGRLNWLIVGVAAFDYLVELPAVEPHTSAVGAIVDLDPPAICHA